MTLDARATVYSADNAKVLAQAATMAYNAPQECKAWAIKQGFSPERFEFFDVNDTQGFVAENDQALIVAFRGTQPNRPVDWMSDAQAVHSPWSHTVGKVHKGFYDSVPITSVTSEKKVVDVKKYYNTDRLRPIYEFDGAPLFIMTSD